MPFSYFKSMMQGQQLPNFYKPSLIQKPEEPIKPEDETKFPKPLDGQFYTPEEIKNNATDRAVITQIVYPPGGGIETHLQYYKYPFKGTPNGQLVGVIAIIKGTIPVMLEFVVSIIKNPFVWFNLKGAIRKTVPKALLYAHRIVDEFLPERSSLWSRPVREVYRIFNPETEGLDRVALSVPNRESLLVWIKIRDLLCLILEFDNAYRFPFQDAFSELNVVELKKHPIRETRRILDLLADRQVHTHLADKYRKIKLIITTVMILSSSFKKKFVEILGRLDVEQIKPDEGDKYFFKTRTDYKFGCL